MIVVDALKAAALLTGAAVLEVSLLSSVEVADARPELTLVALVALALFRGPLYGACAGFWAGLVLDTASLGTLGLTSLVLTIVGYWCGRFGEVTTRSSAHPPLIAVALATVGFGLGSAFLHFMLGERASAADFLAGVLLPSLALNLLLAYPIYRLVRRVFGALPRARPAEASASG